MKQVDSRRRRGQWSPWSKFVMFYHLLMIIFFIFVVSKIEVPMFGTRQNKTIHGICSGSHRKSSKNNNKYYTDITKHRSPLDFSNKNLFKNCISIILFIFISEITKKFFFTIILFVKKLSDLLILVISK